jgi:hypothetical protein
MSNEPEYLRRLRENQERHDRPAAATQPRAEARALSVQEREATKWARESAGTDLRSVKNLPGSRYAVLLKVQSATGSTMLSLEGLASRDALLERLKPGAGFGEEIVGVYEVRGGRPVTISTDAEGQLKLTMGSPRPGANPVSPEKMLRQVTAQAAVRAKTRTRDPERQGRGKGGR